MNFLIEQINKWQDIIDNLFARIQESVFSIPNSLIKPIDSVFFDIFPFDVRLITLFGITIFALYSIIIIISSINLVFPSIKRIKKWQAKRNPSDYTKTIKVVKSKGKSSDKADTKSTKTISEPNKIHKRSTDEHAEDIHITTDEYMTIDINKEKQPMKRNNKQTEETSMKQPKNKRKKNITNHIDDSDVIAQDELLSITNSLRNLSPKEYKKAKKEQLKAHKKNSKKDTLSKNKSQKNKVPDNETKVIPKSIHDIDDNESDYSNIEDTPTINIQEISDIEEISNSKHSKAEALCDSHQDIIKGETNNIDTNDTHEDNTQDAIIEEESDPVEEGVKQNDKNINDIENPSLADDIELPEIPEEIDDIDLDSKTDTDIDGITEDTQKKDNDTNSKKSKDTLDDDILDFFNE